MLPIKISRRGFMVGAGAAALAGPLLSRLGTTNAAVEFPKRFIAFYTPSGMYEPIWGATNVGPDFELAAGSILEPLAPMRDYIVPLAGLKIESAHHGPVARSMKSHGNAMMHVLTAAELPEGEYCSSEGDCTGHRTAGIGGGISVDELIADEIGEAPIRSLHLGVGPRERELAKRTLSYRGPEQPVPDERDPSVVFERIFGGAAITEPGLRDRRRGRRLSALDHNLGQLHQLRERLGTSERSRLDAHVEGVRELERELRAVTTACTPMSAPGDTASHLDSAMMPRMSRLQIDLLVAALSCGRTQVGSLVYNEAQGRAVYPFLEDHDGRDQHLLCHAIPEPGAVARLASIGRWFAGELRYLLESLQAVPEGDGTLLDNTLVLWCTEHSNPLHHGMTEMLYVLAGRAGGALSTGRYVRYERDEPHGNLMVSICNAMGIDLTSFGTPEWCSGPLTGLV